MIENRDENMKWVKNWPTGNIHCICCVCVCVYIYNCKNGN